MKNILFVCTGNTCRSSMAEALLRHLAAQEGMELNIKSAGTAAYGGDCASRNAVKALEELGIDLTTHRSKGVTAEMLEEADVILTMTRSHRAQVLSMKPEAADKIYTLAGFCSKDMNQDISDPFGGDLYTYIRCRDEIAHNLKKLLGILKEQK